MTIFTSDIFMCVVEFETRHRIMIEHEDGPLGGTLMAFLTLCRSVGSSELSKMDVLMTYDAGSGCVNVSSECSSAFFHMTFIALGKQMPSD